MNYLRNAEPQPIPAFNFDFTLNTIFPLTRGAYNGTVPDGWTLDHFIELEKDLECQIIDKICHNDRPGTHFGIVARQDDTVAVFFRGTLSLPEWAEDFECAPIRDAAIPGARIESGFEEIWNAVHASCEKGCSGKVIIGGHSLGAALAILFAAQTPAMVGIVPKVVTISGPRVGNKEFAGYFDQAVPDCYRIVNRPDIVPHYPLEMLGYKHVGIAVEVDGKHDWLDPHSAHSLDSAEDGLRKLLAKMHSKSA